MKKLCLVFAFGVMGLCANAQAVKVLPNGNVGIGRAPSTAYNLDVKGTGYFGFRSIFGFEKGIVLGTSRISLCNSIKKDYPAIYSPDGSLFFGIPTKWAYCTYSSYVYTTLCKTVGYPQNITPCPDPTKPSILTQVTEIKAYMADVKTVSGVSDIRGSEPDTNSGCSQKQYIFLAEELQQVFPELVSVFDDGEEDSIPKLAINYTGMIPILTAAINEQQEIITTQQAEIHQLQTENVQQQAEIGVLQQIAFVQEKDLTELQKVVSLLREAVLKCCKEAGDIPPVYRDTTNNNNSLIKQVPILYQNTPNPFSSNTEISCDIPTAFSSAFIYIYNLQGVELMSFPIVQTGYNTVTIYASALPAGMYLYTLVVDNQIVDTKRMILTK